MRLRRTDLIAAGCISVLVGLGLARVRSFEPQLLWLSLLPLLLLLRRRNIIPLILVIFAGVSLGLWRGQAYVQKLDNIKQLSAQKVSLELTATSDSIYSKGSQIEFTGNHGILLSQSGSKNMPLAGSYKISGFGEPMIYRGDRVNVSGKLFPMRGSNQGRIAYAKLKRAQPDNSWINAFTRRLSAGMQSALPEPNASFGLGLLIGQRNTLPQELTNQLIMVGLVHIVAVSGYNLTILVRAVGRLKMGSKYQRLIASLALIAFFVLMTGFSASIVRAAIVSVIGLWAWYYGRNLRPIVQISFAAALTGFANPFYVWGDLSWYLSFLAFFGVLIVAPLVAGKLFRRPPKVLGMVVIETLCAEIMTLPLIVMSFGQLSLIGLAANTLVVPLIPLAMLFSALAAGAGMAVPALAGWLAWPANALLTYILDIVRLLAQVPGAFQLRSISPAAMVGMYCLVALVITAALRQKAAKPNGHRSHRSSSVQQMS